MIDVGRGLMMIEDDWRRSLVVLCEARGGDPRTLGEDPKTSPAPPGQGCGRTLAGRGPENPGRGPDDLPCTPWPGVRVYPGWEGAR